MAIKDMYYTIFEAAKELSVSRQTIYRWIADKKIPAEKIGGVILVEKKAVIDLEFKRFQESFSQMIASSTVKFARREFGYSDEDKIVVKESEDDYLIFIVTRKNGKREKIKIGGADITISVGRKQQAGIISDMKFKDVIRTECRQTKKSIERSKKK